MALLVSDLIDNARDRAFPYGVGNEDVPDAVLMRHLGALDYSIVAKVALMAPDLLDSAPGASPVTIVLASNATGYALVAALRYHNFEYEDVNNRRLPIRILGHRSFEHPPVNPSGIMRANTFFPADPDERGWAGSEIRSYFRGDGDKFHYRTIPLPTRPTALSDSLASPDFAREYFELSLVSSLYAINGAPPTMIQLSLQQQGAAIIDVNMLIVKSRDTKYQSAGSSGAFSGGM